jgi:hypothetical protein
MIGRRAVVWLGRLADAFSARPRDQLNGLPRLLLRDQPPTCPLLAAAWLNRWRFIGLKAPKFGVDRGAIRRR